ncbi:MAG: 2-oxo-4-hydroxy-4-carboxy-5-ureidoimidazoline decarboxylase [Pirellulales bacterium]
MSGVGLAELNRSSQARFVEICGPFFEHSPWIAERTWSARPFASLDALHAALVSTLRAANDEETLDLILRHPDLVGRLAREGALTAASTSEQAAAGLTSLTPGEIAEFDRYNAAYRAKFDFPFIICARIRRTRFWPRCPTVWNRIERRRSRPH